MVWRPTGTSAFGLSSVSGRSLDPTPAARITALRVTMVLARRLHTLDVLDRSAQIMKQPERIAPPEGKLAVFLPGLGAVATTFIAGCLLSRKREALPIGSLTQMGTIRLGKRTDKRAPKISEFVPLAKLEDLEFCAWDPIPDNAYQAAVNAKVLERHHLEAVREELERISPK